MALVKANGININAAGFGQGEPVIVIHGMGGNMKTMYPLMHMLRRHCQVILYDCRGHGKSDSPASYTLQDQAKDVIGLMDALGLKKVSLIGFSMGSYIASLAVAMAPQRFNKLVLLGGKAYGESSSIDKILRNEGLDPATVTESQYRKVMSKYTFSPHTNCIRRLIAYWPQFRNPLTPEQKKAESQAMDHFDLRPELAKITVPTLVLTGQHDGINTISQGQELASYIPNAKFRVIKKAGHMAFCAKGRYQLQKELLGFLTGDQSNYKKEASRRVWGNAGKTIIAALLIVYFVVGYVAESFVDLYYEDIRNEHYNVFKTFYIDWGEYHFFEPQTDGEVLLVGSSSMDFWPDDIIDEMEEETGLVIKNHGIAGTTNESQIYWAKDVVLDYDPRAVVYYCGYNDLVANGASAEEVFFFTMGLFEKMHRKCTDVDIIYLSFTPSPTAMEHEAEWRKLNEYIIDYAADKDWLHFIDSYELYTDENGQIRADFFAPDGIHASKLAYYGWGDAVVEALKEYVIGQ